ncbi:hypothetical protein JCM17823_03530 [Halorubrum gandharaense]
MVTAQVEGMARGGCEKHVTDALGDLAGVELASADHENGTATVEGDVDIDVDAVLDAIEAAGYDASA